jgi:hypothetical protein
MTKPTNLISLDQRRRAQRALHFFAELLGGGNIQPVGGLSPPLPHVHHLPRLKMDIAVTCDPAPAHLKQILAFARRRQFGFLLVRYRDPAPQLGEAEIAAVLFDGGGIAVLDRLWPATADGRRWTLVGPRPGDVHLRATTDGLVPTLTDPWLEEDDRESFVSKADAIFAEYLWRD